jgi:hypothetical protein
MSPVLVNPFVQAAAAGTPDVDGNTHMVAVTIPSGTVGSNLTSFPVMVRLSDMPAGFWTRVQENGGDLRAWASGGGSRLPLDVARFDYWDEDGVIFVKTSLTSGSDTVVEIHYGQGSLSALAYTDTNGRNNVWSDYETVALLGETAHNRTGKAATATITGDPDLFELLATSPDVNGHEGVCTDGTHYYVFDSAAIRKYDLTWSLVATQTSLGTGITDLGGGTVYSGVLYVAAGDTGTGNNYLATYQASDLAHIQKFDVSAFADTMSDVCRNPNDGLFYGVLNSDGSKLVAINGTTGAHGTDITLTSTITTPNGVTFWHGAFWVASLGDDETYRVETDGTVTVSGVFGSPTGTFAWEGLDAYQDRIYQLEDTGTDEVVYTYSPYDITLGAGGGSSWTTDARIVFPLASSGALGTTWTIGVTIDHSDATARAALTLTETTGTTNRVTIAVEAGTNLGVWDSSNVWLQFGSPLNPAAGTKYRINAAYDGTTARHLYLNGGSKATDSTITARGSTLSRMVVGNQQADAVLQPWRGELGFAYCRAGVLSDDWIAAEYSNLNAPGTFAQPGSESLL